MNNIGTRAKKSEVMRKVKERVRKRKSEEERGNSVNLV